MNFINLLIINNLVILFNLIFKASCLSGDKFFKICSKNKLIETIPKHEIKNPKISIVIPVYNGLKYLKRVTRTIQNQNMADLEIVFVDDFSNDDSIELLKTLRKEDKRIVIYSNKLNKGILYSKSFGVSKAKGEYIYILDQDDAIFTNNVLSVFYKIATDNDLDVLHFKEYFGKKIKKMDDTDDYTYGNYLTQPKLSQFIFNYNYNDQNFRLVTTRNRICGKLINREVYIEAIKSVGKEFFNKKILNYEDVIMTFLIYRSAQSYGYVNKIGYFHVYSKKSTYHTRNSFFKIQQTFKDVINCITIISKNTFNSFIDNKLIFNIYNFFLRQVKHKYLNNENKINLKKFLSKIYFKKLISKIHKKKFRLLVRRRYYFYYDALCVLYKNSISFNIFNYYC